jgi:hypothetical protein
MNTRFLVLTGCLVIPWSTEAQTRTSAAYVVPIEAMDAGGGQAASVDYTSHGSFGVLVGPVTTGPETLKSGYVSQLTTPTGLALAAGATSINEGGSTSLTAWQTLDDLSLRAVSLAATTWSVVSGPASVAPNGIATALPVYQTTPATVRGSVDGLMGTLDLSVLNSLPDNFGLYAADGLPDDWQVQHFGVNSLNGGPQKDPDADGQTNLFEYHARLLPNNPTSLLRVNLLHGPTPGLTATQSRLSFSPAMMGVDYTIQTTTDFRTWVPLTTLTAASDLSTLLNTDSAAGGAGREMKYYRVAPMRRP